MTLCQVFVTGCLGALCAAATAQSSYRYQCDLIDGSRHWVTQDLQTTFGSAARCVPVVVAALAPARVLAPVDIANTPAWARGDLLIPTRPESIRSASTVSRRRAKGFLGLTADLARDIEDASAPHNLDPVLVAALIYTESGYRWDARSPKGALGLMQIMPSTARRYGVEDEKLLLDKRVNLQVGTTHLSALHSRYGQRLDLVLAAYNAGEGAVRKHQNRVPPYPETQHYVESILGLLDEFRVAGFAGPTR